MLIQDNETLVRGLLEESKCYRQGKDIGLRKKNSGFYSKLLQRDDKADEDEL